MIDTSNKEIQGDYDFVVVGAGAAGSVLAAELSASGAQVLLIESGGPDDGPTIANPSIWFYNVASPLDYHLPINPSPRLNNRKFNMALGHVLGGGTSINAMVWMRGMIGKAARMNGAVLVARYTFAGQKILTQPRPLSSTQPARWACPFWPT
jgi:choline dehydrogenase-like flavoprotein